MKNKDKRPGEAAELRWQAEEIAREKAPQLSENLDKLLSPEEQWQLHHELQVHQIELEMQNQALRRTQEELESSRVRYFNLYDLAPVGYFTLSEEGLILEANLTAGSLLGVARSALVKKSLTCFIFREDQDIYYHHRQKLFETGAPQVCELRLVKKDGSLFWARLEATVAQDSESGDALCRAVISDITERKQAELLMLIQRDLALAISFSHQLDEVLSRCLDTMLQLSEMDCGRIYLIDQASGDLNLICHRNLSPAFIKSVSHYKADSTYARLVLQGKPLFTRYSEFEFPLSEVRKAEKLQAFEVLPLIFENQVIGCLNLGSKKLEDVSEINRQVLKTAATLMGEGITRLKIEEELKLSYQKLQKAMKSTIQAIALILEKRDPYTAGHQKRMTKLACAIAEEISLSQDKIERLYMAGILHDIGKINVPTEILSKPGRLSEIEFNLIKTHPQVANDILKEMELPWEVSAIVLQHHERMDGSGYPAGLSGEAILLESRILAIADVVEAMSSHRPYRPALGLDKALEEITKNRGKLYDPEVVDACVKLFKKKGFKLE